jgi:hypothetical protein
MRQFIKIVGSVIALVVVAQIAYFMFSLATGEARMRKHCGEIRAGMSFQEVQRYAEAHGLLSPRRESGVNFLAESRSFGRFACKVTLEAGVVRSSEYNFAD